MWVVKLGGSLHSAPALRERLAELATLPGPACVVVPGGGPFANAVRELQPALGVDDLAAHRMAILAMQQFGLALQALEPRLELAETLAELRRVRRAVWLPWRLAGREARIPASWEVTSDSLACWLATKLRASGLLLVKSAPLAGIGAEPAEWEAAGLVDRAFRGFALQFGGRIQLAHADDIMSIQE
jgi:5-(aminomethyl)-3-furanmethanol phosphate kinase